MYLKDIILKATTHINICKGNPPTNCGIHLQFADSTYNLRIPLTVADSATAQFNNSNVFLFVYEFHKLFWIPQIQLRFPQLRLLLSNFERYNHLGICLWNPKQHRRSEKNSEVADSATNLILHFCGFRLQCRECTVWPRNVTQGFRHNVYPCSSSTFS